jgi:hypothetical protein
MDPPRPRADPVGVGQLRHGHLLERAETANGPRPAPVCYMSIRKERRKAATLEVGSSRGGFPLWLLVAEQPRQARQTGGFKWEDAHWLGSPARCRHHRPDLRHLRIFGELHRVSQQTTAEQDLFKAKARRHDNH